MTPPRVRSLERMEGRRPGVRCGAGRCPISPRAPERRVRGPPGALGSPAAFPPDMLPGREEERDNNVKRGDGYADPGLNPTHLVARPPPRQCVPPPNLSSSPPTWRLPGPPQPEPLARPLPRSREAGPHPRAPRRYTVRVATSAPALPAAGPRSRRGAEVCVAGPGRRHLAARRK